MGNFSIWHWLVVLLVLLILLAPAVSYITSFRRTAMAVNARGGDAPVNSAWLLLVPLLNVAWFFVLLMQLRNAVQFTKRDISDNL
jgi:hypothetical protein